MRANVLNDKALVKLAGRSAWLSIDGDKPENAAFVEKYPINAWPSFLVIDPAAEKIVLRWEGTATAEQLASMIEDGARWIAGGGSTATEKALARADAAYSEKKYAEAAKAYREALDSAPKAWSRRARVLESEIMALSFARPPVECVTMAVREAPSMPRDRSFANVLYNGLSCGLSFRGKPEFASAQPLIALAEEAVKVESIFSDDRSGLYSLLGTYRNAAKDTEGAKKNAEAWLSFLEAEIKREPTAEGRASLISNMGGPARILGASERVIPYLEKWEQDLPGDYNPSSLLANNLLGLKRYDAALAAANRALEKAYGAPKLGVYAVKARIQQDLSDIAGVRATLEAGLKFAATLPQDQSVQRRIKNFRSLLEKLAAGGR